MYLSNKDLRRILQEMKFETPDPRYPFEENKQIQICSIDIRLGNVFWKQKKSHIAIDLRKSKLLEISPKRLWKKIELDYGSSITLKPGEMILGRTHERFSIPEGYAGKIITRSSYSRLGIETACTNDFINPGWRGYVPLEIINNSMNAIVFYPLVPVCQIILTPLTSPPEGRYGDKEFGSKYQNDDGGPSYWWRDNLLTGLKTQYHEKYISEETLGILINRMSTLDDDVVFRFDRFLHALAVHKMTNPDEIIEAFQRSEANKQKVDKILFGLRVGVFPILLSVSLGAFFAKPYWWLHYIVWGATIVAFFPFICAFLQEKTMYYTETKSK